MEKEFCTYNQALALKELGFDEPCFKGYTEEYKTLISFTNAYTNTSVKNTLPTKPFTVPLYQQAFRWFREKHNLYGLIDYMLTPNMAKYKILKENDLVIEVIMAFGEYEEAESKCLDKLIEIVRLPKP